jgi:hypothetical protein
MERKVEAQPTEMMERVVRVLVPPENREMFVSHAQRSLTPWCSRGARRFRKRWSPWQRRICCCRSQRWFWGLPIGCVLVFLSRWQMSGMTNGLRLATARSLSMQELMQEARSYESISRRNIRIEIGAGFIVVASFTFYAFMAPDVMARIGRALIAAAGVFIVGYLHRHAHVPPMPEGLSFEESLRFQRERLEYAKQMMLTAIWLYVLPLTIGPMLLIVHSVLDEPIRYRRCFSV